jgi:undecaprenyl diphosphate synthase
MNIPNHVAIIPDGNRRWAKEKGLPTFQGHQKGYQQGIEIGRRARKMGIKVLTFWAFSTENWQRTQEEVGYLMNIFKQLIDEYLKEALAEKIRIVHLGRKDRINDSLRKKLIAAEEKTKNFDNYYLAIALDYGGHSEILRAFQRIFNFKLPIAELNESNFYQFLDTKDLPYPNPDLIIRSGGENRLSGFMPWQSQYSEFVFVKKYFPDFTPDDFEACIKEYMNRQRRFGR